MKKILIIFLLLFNQLAFSEDLYDFKIINVIDGDTLTIEALYLPKPLKPELKLRIIGVDTPEKGHRAKCDAERTKALEAKAFTQEIIDQGKVKKISLHSWDKYGGRVLGDVLIDGKSLSKLLIQSNYAVKYDGGKKTLWCKK
jgi:micrococcal nuclease